MPSAIDIPSIISIAKICQYLSSNDKSKSIIFQGGNLVPDYANTLRMVRRAVEYAYGANPNDPTLIATGTYLISLCYNANQAQQILSGGGICVSPIIIMNPINVTVTSGGNASFVVAAIGTNLVYQWQFNTVNISGANSTILSLTSVNSGNAGSYRCVVSNGCGTVISTSATLTVNAISLNFNIGWSATDPFVDTSTALTISHPQSISFASGGNLVFSGSLTAFANQYIEVSFPATEPTPTNWGNSVLNNGPIPDFSFRDVWTVGSLKYICARNQVVLDTAGNLSFNH